MRLTDLLDRSSPQGANTALALAESGDVEITGLTSDSRKVEPGFLFAAFPGAKASGVDFVGEAVQRGAVAILAAPGLGESVIGRAIIVEDSTPRLRFAHMAAAFYGAQPERMVAVTGTSGKSSTVSFARQIWQLNGFEAASLGTLGIESRPISRYGALTTADTVDLSVDLAALAESGVIRAAMEASSHGLDQYRLDGVRLRAAGFTSFGRDHLDYHGTLAAYFAAKLRLFTEVLPPGGAAVLNADIPEFERLSAAATQAQRRVLSYGLNGKDLRILRRDSIPGGQTVTLASALGEYDIALPLVGEFQSMNALCALGLVLASEFDDLTFSRAGSSDAQAQAVAFIRSLAALHGVRGRLEHVASLANGAAIYVDYAHKPDALAAVLEALRPHAAARLIVAFGCGGDRDPGKRPMMGAIASKLADIVIVTDDNPRSEAPAAIRAAVLVGATGALEIGDREEAIAAGIRLAQDGDIFVIAGKGHEQGQIVGSTTCPFDDADVARRYAAELSR